MKATNPGTPLLLLALLLASPAHARQYSAMNSAFSANSGANIDTDIAADTLTYQNKRYYLCNQNPMTGYLEKEHWLDQIKPDATWTGRGYISHWVIENDALFLTHFNTPHPRINADVNDLLATAHRRLLAYWFTGTLDIKLDKQHGPNYERRYICGSDGNQHTLRLIFEHGLLKQVHRLPDGPQK